MSEETKFAGLHTNKYGLLSVKPMSDRDVEWHAFRLGKAPPDGLGKKEHFIQAMIHTWPEFIEKKPDGTLGFSNKANPWLWRCLEAFTNTEYAAIKGDNIFRSITLTGAGGAGKAQPLHSLIITPDGPKRMGDLRKGDLVCVPAGGVARISGIFPQGERDVYKISLSDGSYTLACKEHLWAIKEGYRGCRKIVDTEYLIKKHKRYKDQRTEIGIEFCKPVTFTAKPTLIPPYLMGVLIGDGTLGGKNGRQSLGISSEDDEILNRVKEAIGPDYSLKSCFRPCDYNISKIGKQRGNNRFKDALVLYGLWGTLSDSKFVPKDYLINDIETRKEVLRGLMDTDGTVDHHRGWATFYSTSFQLAQNVQFLIQSLGGTCTISKKKPFYRKDSNRVQGKLCYVCHIKYADPTELFHLTRKKKLTKKRKLNGHQRLIKNVELHSREQTQCILIDHPSHLYLTDNFIATHNTQAAGLYAVGWWGCSPQNSIAILTSTTKEMIRHRIWPVIQHYTSTMADTLTGQKLSLGHMLESQTTLQSQKGDYKHAIFALAVAHGETQRALHNLKGMHAERILLVIDEANGTPEAIFEAIPNLRKGCKDFTVIIIGNPTTRLDPHGRSATPVNGWSSIETEAEWWQTKGVSEWQLDKGVCLRFDGKFAPNVLAGKDIYPYQYSLQNWRTAQEHEGTFAYWSQDRGMWPPEGMSNTVFNEHLIERCKIIDQLTFVSEAETVAFLDTAFGGDACVLQFGQLGDISAGTFGLQLTDWLEVPISPEASAHDVDYQIARRVIEECKNRGVKPACFGLDATGVGRGVAAIMAAEWSPQIQYTWWGGSASDRPSAQNDGRPGKEVYANYVAELWFATREAAEAGQIKGFSRESILEFCARQYEMSGKRYKLETKDDMRVRMRYSPDHADAIVGVVEVSRRNGLEIAGKMAARSNKEWDAQMQKGAEILGIDGPEESTNRGGWAAESIHDDSVMTF